MMTLSCVFNNKEHMEDKQLKINNFLNGSDPMEHIVNIECSYTDEQVYIIYYNEKGEKRIRLDDFKPFVWAKNSVAVRMFNGDRETLKKEMVKYGIGVKALKTQNEKHPYSNRLENGYKYLFYAKRRMSFQKFLTFFQMAKTPIYESNKKKIEQQTSSREFLSVSPIEQYMISTGRRMFKGYEGYDEIVRLQFDLETEGLNPEIHAIDQIGIRTNRGFEKVLSVEGVGEERKANELRAIIEFLEILWEQKPDVVCGYNSENFDWQFIITRCIKLGTSLEELSLNYWKHPIYKRKKETVLKLGGEVEYFKPTIMWGHSIIDGLHAVRRAQAIDSNMKLANLKYVTKYLEINKTNRVYVKGGLIGTIWRETDKVYAFNNTNGDYYKVREDKPLQDGYEMVSGKYIVERYLLDDIWETDKVELALNEANFLISKILPTTFQRACTMGTAGIWKLIMLAWSYENMLAIPAFGESKRFTGGLSRLLKTGFADRIVKLDYNSLYPSIMLTWNIMNDLDIDDAMLELLNYVLTNRELYKQLKADEGAKAKAIKNKLKDFIGSNEEKIKLIEEMNYHNEQKSANDKKQLPLKILGNSMFGSFGAPNVFPFGNVVAAEKVTCVGRQSLRLMISHFTRLGYAPIVGDSFMEDTPVFIRYKDSGLINIVSIGSLIDKDKIAVDALGREYDTTTKPYQVLCRSGWSDVSYIYRHKTDKDMYEITDNDTKVCVTKDHSVFDNNKQKITPTEINKDTQLEYYKAFDSTNAIEVTSKKAKTIAKMLSNGIISVLPIELLNTANKSVIHDFLNALGDYTTNDKVCLAQLNYIKRFDE